MLGIERPALDIGVEAGDLAQFRQVLVLLLDRNLQMVPRNGLVISQGRQGPARHFFRVAQVDIIGPRTRAIERGALIITARRAQFGRLRHTLHRHLRFRQGAEELRQLGENDFDLLVEVGQQLVLAGIGVVVPELRVLVHRRQTLAGRPPGHVVRLHDGIHLGRDFLHLVEADLMHLVGRQGCRGIGADAESIARLAIRNMPHAGIVRRLGQGGFQSGDLTAQRRQHAVLIGLGRTR